jgi:hypothetical protein
MFEFFGDPLAGGAGGAAALTTPLFAVAGSIFCVSKGSTIDSLHGPYTIARTTSPPIAANAMASFEIERFVKSRPPSQFADCRAYHVGRARAASLFARPPYCNGYLGMQPGKTNSTEVCVTVGSH